jgi:hypothetical protein
MIPVAITGGERWPEYSDDEVALWRDAALARRARLTRRKMQDTKRRRAAAHTPSPDRIRAEIAEAVARVRARRVSHK